MVGENSILRQRFKQLGFKKIAPFIKEVNSCLTAETWGRMLNRDERVDTRTLMIMTAELSLSTAQLRSMLLVRKEIIISGLLSDANIGHAEQHLLNEYRKLEGDQDKIKLILDMIGYLSDRKSVV